MNTPHLWEPKHPYYCSEGCYYGNSSQTHTDWPSWAAFAAEMGEADVDMNLVWRWDWEREGEDGKPLAADGVATLRLFIMHQRKAAPHSHCIAVTRSDEPAVYAFLQKHWETVQAIWAPFTAASGPAADEIRAQLRARRIAELRAELAQIEGAE